MKRRVIFEEFVRTMRRTKLFGHVDIVEAMENEKQGTLLVKRWQTSIRNIIPLLVFESIFSCRLNAQMDIAI